MEFSYYLLILIMLILFFAYFIYRPRMALLIGLLISTVVPLAVPWSLLQIQSLSTLAQYTFITCTIIFSIIKHRKGVLKNTFNQYLIMIVIFGFILWTYTIGTPAPIYGFSKSLLFTLKSVIPLISIGLLGPFNESEIRAIYYTFIIGSVLVAINVLLFGNMQSVRISNSSGEDPITISRSLGIGASLILYTILSKKRLVTKKNIVLISGLVVLVYSMLLTGSRGPLLAIAFSLICSSLFLNRKVVTRVRVIYRICIMALLLGSGFIMTPTNEPISVQRLQNYMAHIGQNTSDHGRLDRLNVAVGGIIQSKFMGVGTGGFARLYTGLDMREYPHNVIVEVAVEQGMVGVLILLVLFGIVLRRMRQLNNRVEDDVIFKALISLWFFSLFNAFVSGDIITNSDLWIVPTMMWWLHPTNTRIDIKIHEEKVNCIGKTDSREIRERA